MSAPKSASHKDVRAWLNHLDAQIPDEARNRKYIPYGTAGFRAAAEDIRPLLDGIASGSVHRCFLTESDTGIMITASHNPIQDNGIKLIGGKGEMLDPEWESLMEGIVNNKVNDQVVDLWSRVLQKQVCVAQDAMKAGSSYCHRHILPATYYGKIYVGRDTRPSSDLFVTVIKERLDQLKPIYGIRYQDFGVITTPALHYLVAETPKPARYIRTSTKNDPRDSTMTEETLTVIDYYKFLLRGFIALNQNDTNATRKFYDPSSLVVDCANGVGLKTMEHLLANVEFSKYLPAELINTCSKPDDILNHKCGADYVKTRLLPSRGADQPNKRYASLDGDADRLVYFFLDERELRLLDGDKILVLFVKYLQDMLEKYSLTNKLTLGAVQTAYANGASTDYLREQLEVANIDCVDTGVKNLHKKALDYDLGVYFEANGHGSIWVSEKAKEKINGRGLAQEKKPSKSMQTGSSGHHEAGDSAPVDELQLLMGILNNYTGDAVSDLLIVETILKHYDWDIKKWYDIYEDRPNTLTKVEIADRNLVKTTDAGRRCLEPEGLQAYIDKVVGEFGSGARSFVRASGTENVIRIYSEAIDQKSADKLSQLIGEKVVELCSLPKMIDKLKI